MITYSGTHIQTIGGADGTPTPEDIAVHAGRLCRFGGAVWYPLITHLVFVGLLAYRRSASVETMLWGFLHDAHETATNDIPRPFKCDCLRREQEAIDSRLIEQYFNLESFLQVDLKLVKQCDKDACDLEAIELGLPNYREIATGHHDSYRRSSRVIYENDQDRALLQRLLNSEFAIDTTSPNSEGVQNFVEVLALAHASKRAAMERILETVLSWDML